MRRRADAAKWIALASAAFGAAFAARPTLLPNAAILLLPFASAETRRSARAWAAAVRPPGRSAARASPCTTPQRFGSPFEFGMRYQLAAINVTQTASFSPAFVGTNLRFYLFQAVALVHGLPVCP